MPIITLLTDSGNTDHYVASVKARILSINKGINIIDITHAVPLCDIGRAAFILRSVFREFPKGSVHLVGVNSTGDGTELPVAMQLEDHFFVGSDNGLFGLISDRNPQQLAQLNTINPVDTTFPERDIFAPAAARLASGVSITDLGRPLAGIKRLIDRQVKATKKQITGQIIYSDASGNLITNIPKEAFDILRDNRGYSVQFKGEKFRKIHTSYHQAEQGECCIVFNSQNLLEIGIYKGNASELLGLSYDSTINIIFED